MTAAQMEAVYNPRVNVKDLDATLARYSQNATDARTSLSTTARVNEDVRYADGPLCTLDLYQPRVAAESGLPLYLFIHGGYWRGMDKKDHSFVVPPLIQTGAVVANVNYDLCPTVSLDVIVQEVIQAVRFCHASAPGWGASPDRLTLVGHSAGAHLAARVLNAPIDAAGAPAHCLESMVGISGVYEPQVILPISVNEDARISEQSAIANDCIANPPQLEPGHQPRVALWAGGNEPDGWIDQTRRYATTLRKQGINCTDHVASGCDHFSVLESAFATDSPEFRQIIGSPAKTP